MSGTRIFALLLWLILSWAFCGGSSRTSSDGQQIILLISIDGFRWDYPEKTETPNLDFFMTTGVHARSLIPCFPTKTFPNHYSIVTGLYPENHGVVSNNMYDPEMGEHFSLSNRSAVQDGRWWGGEPIWVTAHRNGLRSAAYYWPGSEAKIKGVRPDYWFPYDGDVANEARVQQVVRWLELPEDKRPVFITLYFSLVDDAGHREGPDSDGTVAAIQETDRLLGLLRMELDRRALLNDVNLILVSDHGMTAISPDSVIFLDDYIDLSDVDVIDWTPVVALNPGPGKEEAAYRNLKGAHPHLKVYKKSEIPARFHYRDHPRIPKIIGIADEGWSITEHDHFDLHMQEFAGGQHGYDPQLSSMAAIFIARGPAFKQGLVVESFHNIHIYELMAEILGVPPAPNDGDLDAVRHLLR